MTAEGVLAADALVRAVPLMLTGLAVGLSFRAGVFNLGAEGQLLVGAAASAAVSIKLSGVAGFLLLPIALAAGSVAGALWAAIAAELKRRFHVLEIISTIMLNFIAIHLVSFLVRGPMQEPAHIYPQSVTLADKARLPIILDDTRLHAGFIIALALAFSLAWIIKRTEVGFRIRAVGASPMAAKSAAMIDVSRVSWAVFCCSGAIAGLAGAIEVNGVTFALYENISPGYGYTAIAVALIAGLSPLGIIASGIFFGILETAASALQRDFGIPSSTAGMIEASLILALLVFAAIQKRYAIFAKRAKPA
ncbi:MAG: ABC transporter permease [Gemmatimonadaceae bacterium]